MRNSFFLLTILMLLSSCRPITRPVTGENSIYNADFEQWVSSSYLVPGHTIESSNPQAYRYCDGVYTCQRVQDAYQGKYALLVSNCWESGNVYAGFFANCRLNGRANTWLGGVPFHQKPLGIKGFYKCDIPPGDSAMVLVNFKKSGRSIGYYEITLFGKHNAYTPFSYTFSPALKAMPDSLLFCATSNYMTDSLFMPKTNSWLQLDAISFTGVKSHPERFDGDFEKWQENEVLYAPGWYFLSGHGEGVAPTLDAHSGKQALRLTTFQGDIDGTPVAEPGSVRNGSYDVECGCHITGSAFSNAQDTLQFWYKYLPVTAIDSAVIGLTFRKKGNELFYTSLRFGASAYRKAELPFSLREKPDTVVIQLQSSQQGDTGLAHVGSVFMIDDLCFKSQRSN